MPLSRFFDPKPNAKKFRRDERDVEEMKQNEDIIIFEIDDEPSPPVDEKDAVRRSGTEEEEEEASAKRQENADRDGVIAKEEEKGADKEREQTTSNDSTMQGAAAEESKSTRVNRFAKWAHRTTERDPAVAGENPAPSDTTLPSRTVVVTLNKSDSTSKNAIGKPDKKWVPMKDLSEAEQQSVVDKWHSLIQEGDDKTITLENRRFQILISALLHARCQEPVVRAAMIKLSAVCPRLTVNAIAAADPADITKAICCLQYHNAKTSYLVRAAKEVQTRFGGTVPEDEDDLKELPGIGPVFADLLANVNTRRVHEQRQQQQEGRAGRPSVAGVDRE